MFCPLPTPARSGSRLPKIADYLRRGSLLAGATMGAK